MSATEPTTTEASEQVQPINTRENDIKLMIAAKVHYGSTNVNEYMKPYVYARQPANGVHIINLEETWNKLMVDHSFVHSLSLLLVPLLPFETLLIFSLFLIVNTVNDLP